MRPSKISIGHSSTQSAPALSPSVRSNHKIATAHHEAGHAFASWHFGFRIKRASVVANAKDNTSGHVLSKSGLHFRSLEYATPSGARIGRLHTRVVSVLAGRAAQCCHRPGSVRAFQWNSDRKAVFDILFQLHAENEVLHVFRYLKARAKYLVEKPIHWFVIQHLAGELLERQVMTGEEINNAIIKGFDLHFKDAQAKRNQTTATPAGFLAGPTEEELATVVWA